MRVSSLILFSALVLCAADPTIVFIGDPHLNQQTGQSPPFLTWTTQTNWIAANQAAWNIQAVLCAGDFWVDYLPNAWSAGWSTIDGMGVPYLSSVGNHDYDGNDTNLPARLTSAFDAQVGAARINAKPWYGGVYTVAGSASNQYILVDAGSRHFLVLALEIFPRPGAITWAAGIINAFPSREVIILTHGYMSDSGTLVAQGDPFGPTSYGLPTNNYSGVSLAAWAQGFANVRLLICGHNSTFWSRSDGSVYGIESNYQDDPQPSRVITLLQFHAKTVTVSNLNTTTGSLDARFPPFDLTWLPAGFVFPKGGPLGTGAVAMRR